MNHIQQENQSTIEALKASGKPYQRLFESAQDSIHHKHPCKSKDDSPEPELTINRSALATHKPLSIKETFHEIFHH